MGFFSGFVDGVKGFFNNLYDELIRQSIIPDMLTDMTTAFTTWFEDTLKALEQWLKDTLDALKKKVPEFIKAGISLMAGLLVGMISMVFGKNGLIAQAASWMSSTIASMLTKLGEFVIAGATLLTGFVTGAYAAITDPKTGLMARVKGAIASAATAIIHAPDIIASWVLIGENIILGLITGIQNKVMDLIKAIKNALTAALDAAAEKLKLGSPSKVWFEVGTQMMRGLESGIRSGISGVKDAVSNIPTPAGLGSGKLAFSTNVSQNVNSFMNSRGFNIPVGSGGTTIINNIDRSNTIEVNPTYKNFQSEARIYHDITAALAVTRR